MMWKRGVVLVGCALWLLAPAVGAQDEWWDEAWPYRVPVTVSGSGTVQAGIDFTSTFSALGLNGALLHRCPPWQSRTICC